MVLGFHPVFAFDDVAVYRPGSSTWYLSLNPAPYVPGVAPVTSSASWGLPGDSPLIGDVNGDGLDDVVVVRADGDSFSWFAGHTLKAGSATQIGSRSYPDPDSLLTLGDVANTYNLLADINGDGADDGISIYNNFNWGLFTSATGTGLGGGSFGRRLLAGDGSVWC